MGSLVFACDSPYHEIFQEAAQLNSEGYHAEAAELLGDIRKRYYPIQFQSYGKPLCSELRCYMLPDDTDIELFCNGCDKKYYNEFPDDGCNCCGSNSYRVGD